MDYYLFIDESGTTYFSKADKSFPILTVCGVAMPSNIYEAFNKDMMALKWKFWETKDIVLHSTDIAMKKKRMSCFLDQGMFSEFIRDMNAIVDKTQFRILSASIMKDKYTPGRVPNVHKVYSMSLEFILERAMHYLRACGGKCCLKVIVERRGNTEDEILKEEFERLVKYGNKYWRPEEFAEFKPQIYFRRKNENVNGLQLADLCAYPIAKHLLDPKKSHPSYPYIDPKIYCVHGNCSSYGLKVFP